MMTLIIIALYIVPLIHVWIWYHISHSKGGSFDDIELSSEDFWITATPGVNLIAAVAYTFLPAYENGWLSKFYEWVYGLCNINTFFNIKK